MHIGNMLSYHFFVSEVVKMGTMTFRQAIGPNCHHELLNIVLCTPKYTNWIQNLQVESAADSLSITLAML